MKRVIALFVCIVAVAACSPLAPQPQISVTPRPTNTPDAPPTEAAEAATLEVTAEATDAATLEATTEATEAAEVEATIEATETAEATEVAAADSDAVLVVDAALGGDVALGEDLFLHGRNGAVPCSGCHSHDSDARLVGPGLLTVAERAATRNPDLTAEEYLHQSIVDPSALVVAGYINMMPKDFGALYSEAEIDALVAYLMSLNAPVPQVVADASAAG